MIRRAREVVVGSLLCAALACGSTHAMQFSSSDFLIDAAALNNIGGSNSSASYQLTSSGGESIIGNGASGSYMMPAGYVAQLPSMIAIKTEPYGLVGYWPLDEHSGSEVYDSSANTSNGALINSPGWVTGKIGYALAFTGTNKTAINVGNDTALQSNTVTIEAWVKTTDTTAGVSYVGKQGAWQLGNARANQQHAAIHDPTTDTDACVGSTNITDGNWHQLVAVIQSGTANGTTLYVDGTQQAVCKVTVQSQSNSVTIGAPDPNTETYAATGTIDQVKLFNIPLTSQQIAAEYSAQNSGVETGLTLQTIVPGVSNTSLFNVFTQTTSGGYNLAINQDHDLQSGSNTLPAIGGSIASPIAWNEGTTKGLGFTLTSTNATAIAGSWNAGAAYAALPNSATTFYTRTGAQSVKDVLTMQLRADAAISQPSGAYTNTMTITGITNP